MPTSPPKIRGKDIMCNPFLARDQAGSKRSALPGPEVSNTKPSQPAEGTTGDKGKHEEGGAGPTQGEEVLGDDWDSGSRSGGTSDAASANTTPTAQKPPRQASGGSNETDTTPKKAKKSLTIDTSRKSILKKTKKGDHAPTRPPLGTPMLSSQLGGPFEFGITNKTVMDEFEAWVKKRFESDVVDEVMEFMSFLQKKRLGQVDVAAIHAVDVRTAFNHLHDMAKLQDENARRVHELTEALRLEEKKRREAEDKAMIPDGLKARLARCEAAVKEAAEDYLKREKYCTHKIDFVYDAMHTAMDVLKPESRVFKEQLREVYRRLGMLRDKPFTETADWDRRAIDAQIQELFPRPDERLTGRIRTYYESIKYDETLRLRKMVADKETEIAGLTQKLESVEKARQREWESLDAHNRTEDMADNLQTSVANLTARCGVLAASASFYKTENDGLRQYQARYEQLAAAQSDPGFGTMIRTMMKDVPVDEEAVGRRRMFTTALEDDVKRLEGERDRIEQESRYQIEQLEEQLQLAQMHGGGGGSQHSRQLAHKLSTPTGDWLLPTPDGTRGNPTCIDLFSLFDMAATVAQFLEYHIVNPEEFSLAANWPYSDTDWVNVWPASEFRILRAAAYSPLRLNERDGRWDWADTMRRAVRLRQWVGFLWPIRRRAKYMPPMARDEMRQQADIIYGLVQLRRPRSSDDDFFGIRRASKILAAYLPPNPPPTFSEMDWATMWGDFSHELANTFADLEVEEKRRCRCHWTNSTHMHTTRCPVWEAERDNDYVRTSSASSYNPASVENSQAEPGTERIYTWGEYEKMAARAQAKQVAAKGGNVAGAWSSQSSRSSRSSYN